MISLRTKLSQPGLQQRPAAAHVTLSRQAFGERVKQMPHAQVGVGLRKMPKNYKAHFISQGRVHWTQ